MDQPRIARNETDPTKPHHFTFEGYIVRRGPGYGIHRDAKCRLCGEYEAAEIHDYEDPVFSAAEKFIQAQAN